jgi:hypothetical protein
MVFDHLTDPLIVIAARNLDGGLQEIITHVRHT